MADPLRYPGYWLLFGLPWPDDQRQQAEAALAVAPPIIPRSILGGDSLDILTVADAYVKASSAESNVVFFSDLTLWLDHHGSTWSSRGTDWEAGKEELLNSEVAALYLTLSHLAHTILCDASRNGTIVYYRDSTVQITPAHRQDLRTMIANRLSADWPDYINRMVSSGRARRVNHG
jgi:hypothetical protein